MDLLPRDKVDKIGIITAWSTILAGTIQSGASWDDIIKLLKSIDPENEIHVFNSKVWISCTQVSVEILTNLIHFCRLLMIWNVLVKLEPQLQRFVKYGTVEHIKVLHILGKIDCDTVCTGKFTYKGHTALSTLLSIKIEDIKDPKDYKLKLDYLLKNYTYSEEYLEEVFKTSQNPEITAKYKSTKAIVIKRPSEKTKLE